MGHLIYHVTSGVSSLPASRPQFSGPLFEDVSPLIDAADIGGGGGKWPLVAPLRFIMDSAFASWLSMKAAVSRLNWL